jgi:hypothetical protein
MDLPNKMRCLCIAFALTLLIPSTAHAQDPSSGLAGIWRAETPDGPQTVVVRPDSSASFGEEIIRWRAVADTVFLALGGEWIGYTFALRGQTLVLSGGDLEEPIELRRVGPPTPRPEGVAVPPVPARSGSSASRQT